MIAYIITTLLSLLPQPDAPSCEATPASECGAPLCVVVKDGVPVSGPCDSSCGTWAPGVPVTCGDIVCKPIKPDSTCRWECRPSADW